MLIDPQLQRIMPTLAPAKRQLYLPHLNQAMQAHAVDTVLRSAAFIAQLAHESGELRWMEELWGPTAAQRRYEPPGDLAARLGNTMPGDGARFKGRGPIQITGRFNYEKFGSLLGVDLVADPALAATPEVAFAIAGLYWQSNGLNELADAQQFAAITRHINGGTNGLADRLRYYERAKTVLGAGAVTRGAPPLAPLTRGHEAIRAARARKPAVKKAAVKRSVAKKTLAKPTAVKQPPTNEPLVKRTPARRSVVAANTNMKRTPR